MNMLFGAGWLGLRSLATGIPIAILANPRKALAAADAGVPGPGTGTKPQYIILSTSADGDSVGCNAPGTYLNPALVHPNASSMAPAPLTLGGVQYQAALPWTQLPQAMLDRTCFFHHATYSVVHSDQQLVQELGGNTASGDMFVSLLASQTGPALGTVQTQPIALGPRNIAEAVSYQNQQQPILAPSALALLLGPPSGVLGQLTALRDSDLDSLNALIKSEGNSGQGVFIDQYVQSQKQLRSISENLLATLEMIRDDSVSSQILAAVTLIRMNVAPVISLHIPFGGDNHQDGGLMTEANETLSGIASLSQLWSALSANDLQDQVSFLSLNVFGRTMGPASDNGRAHNQNHHMALLCGAPFAGSVIGGVEAVDADFGAMSISSTTGAGIPNGGGDIPLLETFQSMALTFGTGVGADASFLTENITGGGKVVGPALTSG
jgi:hypothetical protein